MSQPSTRPFTLESLQPPSDRGGQWRRIPTITKDAITLVSSAGPKPALFTILLQVIGAAVVGAQLLVGKRLLSDLIAVSNDGGEAKSLASVFALLIIVTIASGVVVALTAQQQRLLSELVARHTFDRIIGVSSVVPMEAYESPHFYDQLARAKASGMAKPIEMVNTVTTLATSLLTSLGVAAVLYTIEPLLLPFVLAAAIPLLISTLHNSRESYRFEYGMTPQSRERFYLMELLTGRETAKEIRVFGSVRFLRRRYDTLTDERVAMLHEFLKRRLRVALTGTVAGAIASAVALGALGTFLVNGRIDVASAVTAGIALQMLGARVSGITGSIGRLVEASMFLDDFKTFMSLGRELGAGKDDVRPTTPSERLLPPAPPRREPFAGLSLENVSFTYPGTARSVLSDIDLRVEPGEIVALVGENGSGKTTLVKLICQLYQPRSGRVVWNGRESSDFAPEEMRADMTVLFQDYIQYHLSARDNIALGRVEAEPDDSAIIDAAVRGGADRFLAQLPSSYDTRLGRQFLGGHELSIGQWQRLALARAFFRGGGFLILDEPTASLDPRAEHELFQQMRGLAEGRSVLKVSHRFSSVRTADRIYVMQQGRITEAGSHAELMALGGHYAELFSLQARAYLHEDAPESTSGALA